MKTTFLPFLRLPKKVAPPPPSPSPSPVPNPGPKSLLHPKQTIRISRYRNGNSNWRLRLRRDDLSHRRTRSWWLGLGIVSQLLHSYRRFLLWRGRLIDYNLGNVLGSWNQRDKSKYGDQKHRIRAARSLPTDMVSRRRCRSTRNSNSLAVCS